MLFLYVQLSGRIVGWRGRLSRRVSAKHINPKNTNPVQARTVKRGTHTFFGTHTFYDKGKTSIAFQDRGQSHTLVIFVKPCKHDID